MPDWTIGSLIDWLVDWLIDWLIEWLIGWLNVIFNDRSFDWWSVPMIDWLTDWLGWGRAENDDDAQCPG